MFVKQILEFLGIEIKYPIVVNVDNVGAIFLASSPSSGQRTRHIDIRYHFVREFIEDGVLKIIFVRSEENDSDMFTKNVTEILYKKHGNKFMDKEV